MAWPERANSRRRSQPPHPLRRATPASLLRASPIERTPFPLPARPRPPRPHRRALPPSQTCSSPSLLARKQPLGSNGSVSSIPISIGSRFVNPPANVFTGLPGPFPEFLRAVAELISGLVDVPADSLTTALLLASGRGEHEPKRGCDRQCFHIGYPPVSKRDARGVPVEAGSPLTRAGTAQLRGFWIRMLRCGSAGSSRYLAGRCCRSATVRGEEARPTLPRSSQLIARPEHAVHW
jgi:hypothetical protein